FDQGREKLRERVLVHARARSDRLHEFAPGAAQEARGGRLRAEASLVGEESAQVSVERGGPRERVVRALASVVLTESRPDLRERLDLVAPTVFRRHADDPLHQPVNVFELSERAPAFVTLAP